MSDENIVIREAMLKRSDRTGNPEIWAWSIDPDTRETVIVYGSMITGGLRVDRKPNQYGYDTSVKKSRVYSSIGGGMTIGDIRAAKQLVANCRSLPIPAPIVVSGPALQVAKETMWIAKGGWRIHDEAYRLGDASDSVEEVKQAEAKRVSTTKAVSKAMKAMEKKVENNPLASSFSW